MMLIGGRLVILEGRVMTVIRATAGSLAALGAGNRRGSTAGFRKIAVEPAPGDSGGVEQIADIRARHGDGDGAGSGSDNAIVNARFDVHDDASIHDCAGGDGGGGKRVVRMGL